MNIKIQTSNTYIYLHLHPKIMKNKEFDWRGLFYWVLNMGSTELIENGTQGRGYSRGFCPYPHV